MAEGNQINASREINMAYWQYIHVRDILKDGWYVDECVRKEEEEVHITPR